MGVNLLSNSNLQWFMKGVELEEHLIKDKRSHMGELSKNV